MRISFDLDDTLICYQKEVPREVDRVPRLLRPWFSEPLREGTVELMRELERQGWLLCIYTTSSRSPRHLKWWFRFYGIRIEQVINQDHYDRVKVPDHLKRRPTKFPPAFGIDLHVDEEGVGQEGKECGFDVAVVNLNDLEWTKRVLEAAARKQRPTP